MSGRLARARAHAAAPRRKGRIFPGPPPKRTRTAGKPGKPELPPPRRRRYAPLFVGLSGHKAFARQPPQQQGQQGQQGQEASAARQQRAGQQAPPPEGGAQERSEAARAVAAAALAAAKEAAASGFRGANKVTIVETRKFAGQDIQVGGWGLGAGGWQAACGAVWGCLCRGAPWCGTRSRGGAAVAALRVCRRGTRVRRCALAPGATLAPSARRRRLAPNPPPPAAAAAVAGGAPGGQGQPGGAEGC
jgi:hypothetical protein